MYFTEVEKEVETDGETDSGIENKKVFIEKIDGFLNLFFVKYCMLFVSCCFIFIYMYFRAFPKSERFSWVKTFFI